MSSRILLLAEFFFLFFLLPVSFLWPYPLWIKGVLTLLGFVFVLWQLYRHHGFQWSWNCPQRNRLLRTLGFRLAGIIMATVLFVAITAPDHFFYVVLHRPVLFVGIIFVYTLFSVLPQNLIYRTFFFERYGHWFRSKPLKICCNALVFSLAHIFFRNWWVMGITFLGGLLFAHTYITYRSTAWVSVEHTLYGNWLFAVGMGGMLGFPGMEG
ncbi:type II CAAX prenyl endopeptidase Rce1 family protein [Altibacter sp. HG106]|uniref:type II CAAX prenyl endopeptidase Rce1 family protein n=1 Tax=Altibacter sp. HG106 TaxID=3023937 RepID=UPI0023508243|nr:CPBP family glutamic-type intramembrane protease [Altibacter sp. HG106]MDC7995456.1 CPBP family intramembrane metalloprotease [Altibacter sp. HG106]